MRDCPAGVVLSEPTVGECARAGSRRRTAYKRLLAIADHQQPTEECDPQCLRRLTTRCEC
jgi:hypothetical protein